MRRDFGEAAEYEGRGEEHEGVDREDGEIRRLGVHAQGDAADSGAEGEPAVEGGLQLGSHPGPFVRVDQTRQQGLPGRGQPSLAAGVQAEHQDEQREGADHQEGEQRCRGADRQHPCGTPWPPAVGEGAQRHPGEHAGAPADGERDADTGGGQAHDLREEQRGGGVEGAVANGVGELRLRQDTRWPRPRKDLGHGAPGRAGKIAPPVKHRPPGRGRVFTPAKGQACPMRQA